MTPGLGVIYDKQPVCPVMPANHDKEAVMRLRAATVLAAVAALVAVAAPPALASRLAPGAGRAPAPAAGPVSAQIRYTTGGVPHILAHDWTSLGFGYGFAFAQDNLCTMANDYVTVEAQRSPPPTSLFVRSRPTGGHLLPAPYQGSDDLLPRAAGGRHRAAEPTSHQASLTHRGRPDRSTVESHGTLCRNRRGELSEVSPLG